MHYVGRKATLQKRDRKAGDVAYVEKSTFSGHVPDPMPIKPEVGRQRENQRNQRESPMNQRESPRSRRESLRNQREIPRN